MHILLQLGVPTIDLPLWWNNTDGSLVNCIHIREIVADIRIQSG